MLGGEQMENNGTCFVCGAKAYMQHSMDPVKYFYSCPICGRYEYYVQFAGLTEFNLNHLSSYLLYNGFKKSMKEYRYFTTMSKERCDEYKKILNMEMLHTGILSDWKMKT